jgi:glutamate synthase (NADPH/NADH) large chain
MSGGIAYVWDPARTFGPRVNPELVELEPLDDDDIAWLATILVTHKTETGSTVAAGILTSFTTAVGEFVKVMPRDYRRVLEATTRAEREGRSVEEAVMGVARG